MDTFVGEVGAVASSQLLEVVETAAEDEVGLHSFDGPLRVTRLSRVVVIERHTPVTNLQTGARAVVVVFCSCCRQEW